MLKTQQFLYEYGFETLTKDLGIHVTPHPSLPLRILNYDQLDSPKTHPVVRECRGLVVDDCCRLVARSFPRFFNWGEVTQEAEQFCFNNFVVETKHDGSLCLLYHYNGVWMLNTRGSFGQFKMDFQEFTWEQAVCNAMNIESLEEFDGWLNPVMCYVMEFCSPYNKIVRRYETPQLYLLTIFAGPHELPWATVDNCYRTDKLEKFNIKRPERFAFNSVEAIQEFLTTNSAKDPTFEGVVMRDINDNRWKIKSDTYLGLHQIKNNNVFNPKHLLPFVLNGEDSELLTYFPEAAETYNKIKTTVEKEFKVLERVWSDHVDIKNQKQFAIAISNKTPFTGLLFQLRKQHGDQQTPELLKQLWRNSSDAIIKQLFKD